MVATFVAISGLALVIFGPTIGTGLLFLMAATAGSFFLTARGRWITVVALVLELAAATVAAALGELHPATFSPSPGDWVRMSISSTLVLIVAVALSAAVQRAMRAAVASEADARQRQHDANVERENLLRAAGASSRLEVLGMLAGGVAHDFNNALVVIQTNAELLRSTTDEAERRILSHDLIAGVQRASATANQLLVFGRGGAGDVAVCEPSVQLRALVRAIARILPTNIEVTATTAPTAWVGLSPADLDQVLLNLILNARDAMPNGGRIELTCHQNDRVVIEVRDDGTGMTSEVREQIFQPFFTTKQHGTGLGLANVWRKVTTCGGAIDIESERGRGTICRLSFVGIEPVATPPAPPSEHSAATPVNRVVLLLEDQEDVRRTFARLLRRRGLVVDTVATVEEAKQKIALNTYDLLLTDGLLAEGTSEGAIRAFRDKYPESPIIICSAYVEQAAMKLDLADLLFLPKPFEAADMNALIDRALGATSDVPPSTKQG
ncbi:MAG: ATP-binding protein [Kofleriaceae bacterium]